MASTTAGSHLVPSMCKPITRSPTCSFRRRKKSLASGNSISSANLSSKQRMRRRGTASSTATDSAREIHSFSVRTRLLAAEAKNDHFLFLMNAQKTVNRNRASTDELLESLLNSSAVTPPRLLVSSREKDRRRSVSWSL